MSHRPVSPRPFALTSLLQGLLLGRSDPTDASLTAGVRAQDPAAFRVLFDRHAPAVWRFLRDLVDDPTFVEEGLQETFVRAYDRIHQLREDGRMAPWLLGIARNVALEHLRAKKRDRPPGHNELSADTADALAWTTPGDDAQSPELLLIGRETESLVTRALARLTDDRRAALLLRVDHGLGYEEISQVLGWTLPKVKNEIHRARLQVREALASYERGAA